MVLQTKMVNENYDPSAKDEQVLDALKKGRQEGRPWGRANPRWLIDETGMEKSNVEFCLRSLRDAGWIQRVSRGLYELVDDPREDGVEETAAVDAELVEQLVDAHERGDPDAIRDAVDALCKDYGDPDA